MLFNNLAVKHDLNISITQSVGLDLQSFPILCDWASLFLNHDMTKTILPLAAEHLNN